MEFVYRNLGNRSRGEIVEVTLQGTAANVRLMDSMNFNRFRRGRQHRYTGGHYKRSPIHLPIPRNGHWYVTADLGGYKGRLGMSVQILPGRLSAGKQAPLTSRLPVTHQPLPSTMLSGGEGDSKTYDVFVCHASEDKVDIARPLTRALQDRELNVWFDEFELRIGDSLRRTIDRGVASSLTGVVILSPAFFEKGWPNYELDGLVTKGIGDQQIILPVWHGVTREDVVTYSPSLADKLARDTAEYNAEQIAEEIAELIRVRVNSAT